MRSISIFLLCLFISFLGFSQTIEEQMKEKFATLPPIILTIEGGIGIGYGFDNIGTTSFLFDFPVGISAQRRFGRLSLGGGAKFQHLTGFQESQFQRVAISYTFLKYYGRGEFVFTETSKGYMGFFAEGGSFNIATKNSFGNSNEFFISLGGIYIFDITDNLQFIFEETVEFDYYKTAASGINYNELKTFILTNQLIIGLRTSF